MRQDTIYRKNFQEKVKQAEVEVKHLETEVGKKRNEVRPHSTPVKTSVVPQNKVHGP